MVKMWHGWGCKNIALPIVGKTDQGSKEAKVGTADPLARSPCQVWGCSEAQKQIGHGSTSCPFCYRLSAAAFAIAA